MSHELSHLPDEVTQASERAWELYEQTRLFSGLDDELNAQVHMSHAKEVAVRRAINGEAIILAPTARQRRHGVIDGEG